MEVAPSTPAAGGQRGPRDPAAESKQRAHPDTPEAVQEEEEEEEEEVACAVCNDGEEYEDNPLVECSECGCVVHPVCYGNPLIRRVPDVWVCEQCKWGAREAVCVLCPQRGGCMKRTTDYRWAHLACSMWVPEVFFRYGEGREPIDCLQVVARRWTQTCCHCKQRYGACIECSQHKCKKTFHVTCGMQNGIALEYHENEEGADVVLSYCDAHARRWRQSAAAGKTSVHPKEES